jgi:hypothetical protein
VLLRTLLIEGSILSGCLSFSSLSDGDDFDV